MVAKKLPDIGIQLWATTLLKDLANIRGNADEERHWYAEHDQFSKMVISDHMQANGSPEHSLINVSISGWICECQNLFLFSPPVTFFPFAFLVA